MIRIPNRPLALLAAAALAACTTAAPPPTPRKALSEVLADNGYAVGAAVEQVPNFKLNRWDAIDAEHIIVFDQAAQAYLVTFTENCYGVDGNRLFQLPQRTGSLTLNDRIEVKHEGRTADYCYVDGINLLQGAGAG